MSKCPKNLREFIKQLQSEGELLEVNAPVSAYLEIAEITDRISKLPEAENKALFFKNIEGFGWPVLINAFGNEKRMLASLGVGDFSEIQDRITAFTTPPSAKGGLFDKLKLLPQFAELGQFFPKTVKNAPCQEVVITDVNQPMLDLMPILTCWPQDGGPFITLPVVYTTDYEKDGRNAGMYRLQKYDNATTGMHWHKHHDGNRLYENARRMGKDRVEVAVALGAPPAVTYSATAPLPPGIDEMIFAGFLQREPVAMVQCKTIDVEVPAESEIILEGYVLLNEVRREGPFGDHTGVYSLADDYPVFHLTAVTHRRDPIYQTTIVGKPPQEDYYLGKATERIFLPLLKLFISEIVDMNMPAEGVFHNCIIVSIDKRYPAHAKKVMTSIWGFGQLMFSKYVVVVDKDCDLHNLSDVSWRVFNHTDPRRDMMFADGPLDILDHATPTYAYGSKMGVDATVKWPSEGYAREWPDDIVMSDDIKARVDGRWSELFSKKPELARL